MGEVLVVNALQRQWFGLLRLGSVESGGQSVGEELLGAVVGDPHRHAVGPDALRIAVGRGGGVLGQQVAAREVIDEGLTETTVEAEATQRRTTVVLNPPDADGDTEDGHQVALAGVSAITVTVTSADGSRERVYRVRFGSSTPERPSDPTSRCFRGDVLEGFSLVVYEGGSLEDLLVCAEGRHVVALYVLENGVYVPYIVGAPYFVNAPFHELYPDGVPPLTTLIAGSNGPPSADSQAGEVTEGERVILRGSNCLRGEITAGFSSVVFSGGSIESLEDCARDFGVTALYALHGGDWVSFIVGAPDSVNQPFRDLFPDGLPPVTPLVVGSDDEGAASATGN